MSRVEEVRALLGSPSLEHDRAQLAIVATLTGGSPEAVEARLDDAARALFGAGALDVRAQAEALATVLTDELALQALGDDHRALLIDEALVHREAHPLLIAVIGHELARRAGLSSFVGSIGPRHWTVLRSGGHSALVGCELLEVPPGSVTVRQRCPHEVAGSVLRALRLLGPLVWHRHIHELLAALPVHEACSSEEDEPRSAAD